MNQKIAEVAALIAQLLRNQQGGYANRTMQELQAVSLALAMPSLVIVNDFLRSALHTDRTNALSLQAAGTGPLLKTVFSKQG